jgi:hypothetical protein
VSGADDRAPSPERKAEFVRDLLSHVHWPASDLEGRAQDLRVQIIGDDPVAHALDRLLAGRIVDGRTIVVTHPPAPTPDAPPHVAFIARSEESKLSEILAAYCRASVLTIAAIDRFAERGGALGLVSGGIYELLRDDGAVHVTINRTATYEARLQIDPELLHLAYPLFSAVSPCARAGR